MSAPVFLSVLILMGLDALTTEETVTKVLEYTSSAKMNISIARDSLTRTSRGYCYVEMDTVETATHLMNILASMQPPFQIDGKQGKHCDNDWKRRLDALKALDTFGNCQRPLFSLGVSQHMYKITDL